jgi:hypothetical protein
MPRWAKWALAVFVLFWVFLATGSAAGHGSEVHQMITNGWAFLSASISGH